MRAAALLVVALAGAAGISPARAATLTLEQALERAAAQSEEIQLTRAQLTEARGRVREAVSVVMPQIDGTVTYGRKFDSIFEGVAADSGLGEIFANSSFGAERDWTLEVKATQLLFDGGKMFAALKAAGQFMRVAEAEQRETSADLAFRVKAAYYQAAAAARLVAIAEGSLRQARDHMGQVALYHREGSRAEFDLLRAQVDAANQEPTVVQARTQHQIAALRLAQLVNLPAGEPIELATPLENEDGTIPWVAAAALESPSRGSLAAAEASVKVYEQGLNATRAERWPVLTASTTLQHQAFPRDEWPERDQFLRNWDAQLKLSLPIFNGFRTEAAIQRARAALLKAKAERDQLRERAAFDLAEARAQLQQSLSVLAARRQTVRQASRAYELSEVRYTNGISTQLEVSDARLGMQTAQVRQVEASRDYLVALAGLERALGRPVPVERKPLESLTLSMNAEASSR